MRGGRIGFRAYPNAARYPARCAGNACLPLRVLARKEDDPMPRYHFAVKDAARYDDPDGTELLDDAAARDYAIRVIREVQHGEEHNWTGWTMEVRQGSALCGKSRLKRLSQITMAEAPIALRTSHRSGCLPGRFNAALCLRSPSLQLC